jgi:hypothetical protein
VVWLAVHGVYRRSDLLIRQGEELADATAQAGRQMSPEGLDQKHMGEVLEN